MVREVELPAPMDQVIIKSPIGYLVVSFDNMHGDKWYITPPPDFKTVDLGQTTMFQKKGA